LRIFRQHGSRRYPRPTNRRTSPAPRAVASIGKIDDGRGPPRDQKHIEGSGVELDPYGHPLGQPDPAEGRVDVGDQVAGRCSFAIEDSRRDALHTTVQQLRVAHEPHKIPRLASSAYPPLKSVGRLMTCCAWLPHAGGIQKYHFAASYQARR
jgi:hypothetical protein